MSESPTQKVVLGIMGAAIALLAWFLLPWWGFAIALGLLVYEAWTLVNDYPNDTISEILWDLAARPIVPWLFGLATAWAIESNWIFGGVQPDPQVKTGAWIILALGFLQGHFWFQAHRNGRKVKNGV